MGSGLVSRLLRVLLLSCAVSGVAAGIEVGNFVWEDQDGDGVQDASEPGLPGVTVQLWNVQGTAMVAGTTTDSGGGYLLTVPSGASYRLRVVLRYPGDRFTLPNVGADSTDSDIESSSGNTGMSAVYAFPAGAISNMSLDVGVIPDPMKDHNIGDSVFRAIANGLQGGLSGFSGFTVRLLDAAGNILQTTTSGTGGFYSFKAPPGTYRLHFFRDEYYIPSPWKDYGADDTIDSDIDAQGYTDLFTVAAGEVRRDVDAGYVNAVRVGDYVWDDLDADGRQDLQEAGQAGVTLELWSSNLARRFATTVSGPDGAYFLEAPGPGNYRVRAIRNYPGDVFSPENAGGDDLEDSDINTAGIYAGYTDVLTFAPLLLSLQSVDIGIVADPMKDHNIGDRVFRAGIHGLQHTSYGRSDITVDLLGTNGAVLQTTVSSGAEGFYSFKAPAGTYRLRFHIPDWLRISPWKDYGADDTIDNDIDLTGHTGFFTVAAGEVRRDIDAGLIQDIQVGDFVWNDEDGDGVQDAGEAGIPGVVLELWEVENGRCLATTTTDAAGKYRLLAPGAGSYRVFVLRPLPADTLSPRAAAAATPSTDSDFFTSGANFGYTDVLDFDPSLLSIASMDAGIRLFTGVRLPTPLRVLSVSRTNATTASLTFTGPSGGTYRIDRSGDMNAWTEAIPAFASTAASTTRSITVPAGQGNRQFFRVRRTR